MRGLESWNRDRESPGTAIDGTVRGPRSMAPRVARDRWHRAWPLREIPRYFLTIYMEQIDINGAGGRVTVVGCPRFGGFR